MNTNSHAHDAVPRPLAKKLCARHAPRLFEQVEIQRFELAQGTTENTTKNASSNPLVGGGAMAGGVLAAIALALPPEAPAEEVPGTDPQLDPVPQPILPFLSDAAFQALPSPKAWTGLRFRTERFTGGNPRHQRSL